MRKNTTQPIVIKYGGSLLNKPAVQKKFFRAMARLSRTRPVVIIHGGGKEITDYLKKLNIKSVFVKGMRKTDAATMEVAEMVLSGKVNKGIVASLCRAGARAAGLSGRDGNMIIAKQVARLGKVGNPCTLRPELLTTLLNEGFIPVISPIGNDQRGNALNLNADSAAEAIAVGLKAERLVFLTDVPGVLNSNGKRIPVIPVRRVEKLIHNRVVTGGMIPKIRAAVAAIKKGVKEVHILLGGEDIASVRGTRIVK
jgi:acetylglutamate kinase